MSKESKKADAATLLLLLQVLEIHERADAQQTRWRTRCRKRIRDSRQRPCTPWLRQQCVMCVRYLDAQC